MQSFGETVRLEIPVRDREKLRKVPDMLRGYAAEIDFYMQRPDIPYESAMFHLAMKARELCARIRAIKGRGRPPAGES